MSKKYILVVGGAGFIGSYVNKMLDAAGYQTIVFDNLSRGSKKMVKNGIFVQGDIGNAQDLELVFKTHKIDAVMDFAAYIDVGESIHHPILYYRNNVANTLTLLETMLKYHVKTFIFSSTAALYGSPSLQSNSISEDHPCQPINPYGRSKLMVESILSDLSKSHGLKYCALRYFNAAGGDPDGEIRNNKPKESNLIPVILRSINGSEGKITINGTDYPTIDGTCIRDYIHIHDLGTAHINAMESLFQGAPSSIYNLGNGKGYSVKEVIDTVEKVTGKHINRTNGPRREGDPALLIANSEKAFKELNWQPQYSLEEIVLHAWKSFG